MDPSGCPGSEAVALARVPAGLATHARPAERTFALRQAAVTAGELVAALSAQAPAVAGEELPAESISQSFFRVREVELSDQQAALHGVLVLHRGLEDLCEAPLSGADLALEAAGMRQSVLDLTGAAPGADPDSVPPVAVPEPAAGPSLESVWSARWLIGHQAMSCSTSAPRSPLPTPPAICGRATAMRRCCGRQMRRCMCGVSRRP